MGEEEINDRKIDREKHLVTSSLEDVREKQRILMNVEADKGKEEERREEINENVKVNNEITSKEGSFIGFTSGNSNKKKKNKKSKKNQLTHDMEVTSSTKKIEEIDKDGSILAPSPLQQTITASFSSSNQSLVLCGIKVDSNIPSQ